MAHVIIDIDGDRAFEAAKHLANWLYSNHVGPLQAPFEDFAGEVSMTDIDERPEGAWLSIEATSL